MFHSTSSAAGWQVICIRYFSSLFPVMPRITGILLVLFLLTTEEVRSAEHELVQFIRLAMSQNLSALDARDLRQLSDLDVRLAEHQFDTRIIPLTRIGFTEGTGSQQLGVEFQKELDTGTEVSYGVVGDRVDENSEFVIENTNSARAYVSVSQGLFRRWGRKYNLTGLDLAKMRGNVNQLNAEMTLQSLVLETSRKYYTLLLEDQLLSKNKLSLERSREHLASARSRQSVGLVSKVDVYRAELAALSAENNLQEQLRTRQRAIDDFRDHLGLYHDEQLDWREDIRKITPLLPAEWEEIVFENRLDWQKHLANTSVLRRELYKAEKDLLPDVGLRFTVEQRGEGDSIEEAATLDDTNWSVQLQMNSPLNTLPQEASLTKKKIEINRMQRQEMSLRHKIVREVRDGLADLQTAERQHLLFIRQHTQAKLALELARIRYEKGLSDNLDVLDAEAALSDAELAISRSLVSYNNAAIHLAYVMGILNTGWLHASVK